MHCIKLFFDKSSNCIITDEPEPLFKVPLNSYIETLIIMYDETVVVAFASLVWVIGCATRHVHNKSSVLLKCCILVKVFLYMTFLTIT
jgi:hypothetical protein